MKTCNQLVILFGCVSLGFSAQEALAGYPFHRPNPPENCIAERVDKSLSIVHSEGGFSLKSHKRRAYVIRRVRIAGKKSVADPNGKGFSDPMTEKEIKDYLWSIRKKIPIGLAEQLDEVCAKAGTYNSSTNTFSSANLVFHGLNFKSINRIQMAEGCYSYGSNIGPNPVCHPGLSIEISCKMGEGERFMHSGYIHGVFEEGFSNESIGQ